MMYKRMICLCLSLPLVLGLYACNAEQTSTTKPTEATKPIELSFVAAQADIDFLNKAYEGRQVYHGEMHDHANTGGTSDGKQPLNVWKTTMESLDMDFATIVDHKQVLHMRLDEWDNTIFIGGSEAMTMVNNDKMHYNMIFDNAEALEEIVTEFSEFNYVDGHFIYPTLGVRGLTKLIQAIKEKGGMFVLVHPKSSGYIISEDPLSYWFADETGLEVFYGFRGNAPAQEDTKKNYKLWTDLLALGARVWATAGSDKHNMPNTDALTTVYSEEQNAQTFLSHFRVGDFVAGPVGIRMAVGDATMGGKTAFAGNRVVFSVGDFHSSAYNPGHTYRVDVLDDKGVIFSQTLTDPTQTAYFAFDAQNAKFYRVEVYDATTGLLHAIGNPIWNSK